MASFKAQQELLGVPLKDFRGLSTSSVGRCAFRDCQPNTHPYPYHFGVPSLSNIACRHNYTMFSDLIIWGFVFYVLNQFFILVFVIATLVDKRIII